MYYLTVDYLIPFQIESNLPDAKKRFRETFGRSSLYFEYFEIQKNQNIQNNFVLANFFEYFEIRKIQNIQNIFVLAKYFEYFEFFEIQKKAKYSKYFCIG